MNNSNTLKACLACGKNIRGRADKKFCDDLCRNSFNNQLKIETSGLVRNINNMLGKNRRILQSLLPANQEMAKTSRDKLLQLGFHFKYFTHHYINKKGSVYHYCYEYGYLQLERDAYLLVKKKEQD
ncbi:MAG: hypothetical protein ABJA78_06810 [Ferruginibacter sp.]